MFRSTRFPALSYMSVFYIGKTACQDCDMILTFERSLVNISCQPSCWDIFVNQFQNLQVCGFIKSDSKKSCNLVNTGIHFTYDFSQKFWIKWKLHITVILYKSSDCNQFYTPYDNAATWLHSCHVMCKICSNHFIENWMKENNIKSELSWKNYKYNGSQGCLQPELLTKPRLNPC